MVVELGRLDRRADALSARTKISEEIQERKRRCAIVRFLYARRSLSVLCHRVDSHTFGSYDRLSAHRRNVRRLNGRVSGAADWGARVSVVCGVWVVDLTCRGVRHVLSIGAQARYRLHRSSIRPTSYREMGGGPRSSMLAGFRQGFG